MAKKPASAWRCQQCGYSAPKWYGRCPDCGEFGTFVEEFEAHASGGRGPTAVPRATIRLGDVAASGTERIPTGVSEFDRVLGGGFVRGSLVLLAGEPGIGKSTLLLQAAASLVERGAKVLYVCGEESVEQVKLRASRIGAADGIWLLPEVDAAVVEATSLSERPDVLMIDSIQTMVDTDLDSVAGSVGQVRASAARLMRLAKVEGMTVVVVGHVTKEGTVAGPRVLEHTVDTVLSFEGDRDHVFRIVRATKNRFGSVSEIGVFEMAEDGLRGVSNPSSVLLSDRAQGVPGSCVLATVEGTRPLLVEVQALVTPSYLQMPRRLAVGVETARVLQSLAVLERRAGLAFGQHDVYVSIAGGVRVTEPAVDLPLALALASARLDVPLEPGSVAFGEVGLTGEVRGVRHTPSRIAEAGRMGLGPVFIAASSASAVGRTQVRPIASVREAVQSVGA